MEREFAQQLVHQVMPSYTVGDLLGAGSSGAVFRIRDDLKERAVKIVPLSASAAVSGGAVESASNRIERDFRHIVESYERIACDEIVTVYDFYKVPGAADRRSASAYAVVVMEIYPANLHDYVLDHYERSGGPLPAAPALALLERLALMIEDLYSKRGFLFEDIKPENILVKELRGGDLRLVVGDIGGLRSLGSVSTTGSQVTLTYCAPETLRRGKKPDLRSIVYSYGLISFFVLEGHLPFDHAGAAERIDLIRSEGLPLTRRDQPAHLPEVLARCLAFDPSERFEDFHEIAAALRSGIAERKDRFGGDTVDLDSFLRRAPAAGAESAPPPPPRPTAPARPAGAGSPFPAGMLGAAAGGATARRAVLPPELTVGLRGPVQRSAQEHRRRLDQSQVAGERQAMEQAANEFRGLVVPRGSVLKIDADSRVLDDILVEPEAILLIENSRLFFGESAGIVVAGTLRAKNATFTAADPVRRWRNVTLAPSPGRVNLLEGCTFRFGRGRTGAEVAAALPEAPRLPAEGLSYGGGLLLLGDREAGLTIRGTTFSRCTAHNGGGLCAEEAAPALERCLFDGCSARLSGGGLHAENSRATVRETRFFGCSADKGGGGAYCSFSPLGIEDCIFDGCASRSLHGGAVLCESSAPLLRRCKFNRCTARKDGGAVWWDDASRPRILHPAYVGCTPNGPRTLGV